MMSDHPFAGFNEPQQNYSKLPHAFIDVAHIFTSQAEVMVVLYILRHTWGFSEYDQPKKITIDEFEHGRKTAKGERIDSGCGMSRRSIQRGLAEAEKHGFITIETDDTDKARLKRWYSIRMVGVSDVSVRGVSVTPQGSQSYTSGVSDVDPDQRKKPKKEDDGKKPKKETALNGTDPSDSNAAIRDLITAWLKDSGVIDPKAYAKKGFRDTALALHKAGITPDDVTAFIADRRKDAFWRDKGINLSAVSKDILPWKAQHRPNAPTTPRVAPKVIPVDADMSELDARLGLGGTPNGKR